MGLQDSTLEMYQNNHPSTALPRLPNFVVDTKNLHASISSPRISEASIILAPLRNMSRQVSL